MQRALLTVISLALLGSLSSCLGDYETRIDHGYLNQISFHPTDSMELFLSGDINDRITLRLFDLKGDEVVKEAGRVEEQQIANSKPYANGYGYKATKTINTPNLPSGIYLWEGIIPFVLRSDYAKEIALVIPTNSWIANNNAGGWSLRSAIADTLAIEPSFSIHRPMPLDGLNKIRPFLEFLDGLNLDDMMLADSDLDNFENISSSKLLILFGESAYWSRQARENVNRFIGQGGDVLVLSYNTMKWQVRYGADQSLICYGSIDHDTISNELLKTGKWSDPSLQFPILDQIGSDPTIGGSNLDSDLSDGGLTVVEYRSPLLKWKNFKAGDVIRLPGSSYDGSDLEYTCEGCYPIHSEFADKWYRYNLIASDRLGSANQAGCFLALQPSEFSGKIISIPSSVWTTEDGIDGPDKREVRKITEECIRRLLSDKEIFY